jgi:hypothetical protein
LLTRLDDQFGAMSENKNHLKHTNRLSAVARVQVVQRAQKKGRKSAAWLSRERELAAR